MLNILLSSGKEISDGGGYPRRFDLGFPIKALPMEVT